MASGSMTDCPQCEGSFYRIGTEGAFAKAVRCSCSVPCPDCSGSGFDFVQRDGSTVAVPCGCKNLDLRIGYYNQAQLPARFAQCFIEDLEETHSSQKEIKYALLRHRDEYEPGQPGYLLWGNPGVGKTHLLCGLVGFLTLERGLSSRYVDFMHLLHDLKKGYAEGRWESELVYPLLEVDVLVIDELGKGRNSEWELAVLDELISARYNAGRTIHGTSNYAPGVSPGSGESTYAEGGLQIPQSLRDRLGERIFSRLHEMCRHFEVSGPDHRMEPKMLRPKKGRWA